METSEPKVCIVCSQPKQQGITVVTEFICSSCESDIVRTEAQDDQYSFFVRQLRRLRINFHV
jgi:hypothetical protein